MNTTSERRNAWTHEKRERFARDWQEGLSFDALREKYGTRRPGDMAAALRARGYVLASRRGER